MLTPLIEAQREIVGILRKEALDRAQEYIFRPETFRPVDVTGLRALFNVLRMEEEQLHEIVLNEAKREAALLIAAKVHEAFTAARPTPAPACTPTPVPAVIHLGVTP